MNESAGLPTCQKVSTFLRFLPILSMINSILNVVLIFFSYWGAAHCFIHLGAISISLKYLFLAFDHSLLGCDSGVLKPA